MKSRQAEGLGRGKYTMISISLLGLLVSFLPRQCSSTIARREEFHILTEESDRLSSSYPCTFFHEGPNFVARCSRHGLREVPSHLPAEITVLALNQNKIEFLSNRSLVDVPAVKTLKLWGNQLKYIMKEALYPLASLEELFLGYNRLRGLSADTFSMNPNLRFLDLSRNNFLVIPLKALNQLSSMPNVNFDANCKSHFHFAGRLLTSINKLYLTGKNITRIFENEFTPLAVANISLLKLSKSNISYIPYCAFHRLKHIKGLELDRNSLVNLSFNSFLGMDSLEHLNLVFNKIVRIQGFQINVTNSTLHFPPLISLNLSTNKISSLSERLFQGLDLLTSLRLRSCRLRSLQNHTFEGLWSLEILDLARNSLISIAEPVLQHVPRLQKLILSDNKISLLDFQLSTKLQHLISLNLSANRIAEIPKNFFRIASLKTLDLSKNRIFSVASGPFSSLSNLTYLILKSNPISKMFYGGFTGLDNLESLDLQHVGFLEQLTVPFKYLHRLSFLDLSHNSFGIATASFSGLTSLRKLNLNYADLTRNKLVINTGPVLAALSHLEVLLLGRNPLGTLFPNTFEGLFHLRQLHLTQCGITSLSGKLFANLSSLEQLHLDKNNILSVTFDHFRYLTSLRYLYLGTNRLSGNLPKDIFRKNTNLYLVSSYQNGFTGIEENTFLPMKYFDISQNHLLCTCNLSWFRSFLSRGNLTLKNARTTVCSPQSLSEFVGKSILEFYPDKVCGPNLSIYISSSTLILLFIAGSFLAWRNRWWLNYKCFHLKLLIIGYYELEDARERQDYRYDLNIIFPIEDEDWVLEEFLVAVQEHLPDFLRHRIVCGDDDLPLGGMRFDAIDRVIENSFKNLVIVSNTSVNDANYLMTLQMAVAHMNDVQLENVVMVFREDIPGNQLPYLVRLFLSKNKPYFQWSEERYQQMLFWEGLTKTLTRNKKMNGLLPL